ncbi:(Fe-S)-binding protein [Sulfurospirillum sp. 1612]|uniref:(Fe-S)-binding protein n=1 Tax=Sulfurospirillum sp. 1612 TaxID=3094835 RepID=UPI002F93BCC5
MKIGLFIPCFMNELYPEASMDTLKILESFGLDVDYPLEQTCCGQPMANTGCAHESAQLAKRFVEIFKHYDYIVAPSGSCVSMVRHHYAQFVSEMEGFEHVQKNTYELIEFIHDIIKPDHLNVSFPYKVGIHNSCHGHRELGLASMSECHAPAFSKIKDILDLVSDISFSTLERNDECCGFGGTFAVSEEAMSVAMGRARLEDHIKAGSEYITGVDMSCLMHMQGLIDRDKLPIKTIYIAQILAKGLA